MNKVIGKINLSVYPEYNDPGYFTIENNHAIIDYGFTANAYEDIALNLSGGDIAEQFLNFVEINDHGLFIAEGYTIEF